MKHLAVCTTATMAAMPRGYDARMAKLWSKARDAMAAAEGCHDVVSSLGATQEEAQADRA